MREALHGYGVNERGGPKRLQTFTVIFVPLWLFFISTGVGVLQRNAQEFYPTVNLFGPASQIVAIIAVGWMFLSLFWPSQDALIRLAFGLTAGVFVYGVGGISWQGTPDHFHWFIASAMLVPVFQLAVATISARLLTEFLLLALVLTVVWDASVFRRVTVRPVPPAVAFAAADTSGFRPQSGLPNVYHFVFDAFQSDVFANIVLPDADVNLDGFTWFRNAVASSPNTVDALAEVFSSEDADQFLWTRPQWRKHRAAFYADAHTGERSLKARLGRAGYHRVGHVFYPTQYPHFADGFDRMILHETYLGGPPSQLDDDRLFFNLWMLSVLPKEITDLLLSNITMQRLVGRGTLARFPSLVSYGAIKKFMGEEYSQSEIGRYVFFHILLPHKPFVFTDDCGTHDKDWNDTPDDAAIRGQYECAGSVINDIVRTLKRLGRFDNSMIVIHADHGDGLRRSVGGYYSRTIDPDNPESFTKALLLVKFPGQTAGTPLRASDWPARVGDVTKTIIARFDPEGASSVKGFDLAEPAQASRERYFYWDRETSTLRFKLDGAGRIVGRAELEALETE